MGQNSCYASLGKFLLLRLAVAASLAACVCAHRQDSDDHDHHHHHNHGHDRGDERGTLVITILKFYAIVTAAALVLLALGAIAFACCGLCCFRWGKGKGVITGDSEAITNKDDKDDCKLGSQKVGGVICATLCWPVVVAGFGCTVVLKLGDTLKRCKVVGGPSNSEVGGSSAKEAAVGDSPEIDWDSFEKTPPVSVVEEGDIDAIELDVV